MKLEVYTTYSQGVVTNLELPEDKSVDDIQDVYMKWGQGTVRFKDGSELEFEEDNDYDYDYKRPDSVEFEKVEDDE